MKYVIIGNGPAAIGAVEGIRKTDAAGEITLLSKEPHHTYSRPLISYLLLGKTDEEKMKYRPDGFYKENSVSFMPGVSAVSLDTENKTVKTEQGGVKYDRLLIAAGSRPFIPPMKGFETVENKFSFMTLDDAKSLRDALTPDSRVLIIGAGLIGLKCAEGIAGLCKSITVVDLADRILSSILDRDAAAIVEAHLREHGLSFHLSDSVEEFTG
ncbi:MAG: FAD-dependent oxidoreductase, partial [Clostridia bacterium]|nr:FAD-dependent oxidoreductase [Clostridia bacterium]